MSFYQHQGRYSRTVRSAAPGDVLAWYSDVAGKVKFYLALSWNLDFVYLNSPKRRTYRENFHIPSPLIPFLDATPEGYSVVSCSHLVTINSEERLARLKPSLKGALDLGTMRTLLSHINAIGTLTGAEESRLDEVLNVLSAFS